MDVITRIQCRKIVRPMKTTFATSLGSKTVLTSVLATVTLNNGISGTGEVPTSFVLKHETPAAIRDILGQAREAFVGKDIRDYEPVLRAFRGRFPEFHMTLAGLEVALLRALLALDGRSELAHWGSFSNRVVTDITIPFITDEKKLGSWLGASIRAGFTTYKVKVSGDIEPDIRLIKFVRHALSEAFSTKTQFTIRLDGNQGYTPRTYLRMIQRLEKEKVSVELFEQPLPKDDYAGFKAIHARSSIPVIVDETVFCAADALRVVEEGLADGINIKIAKSGIAESAAILRIARAGHLRLMIGCMTETMAGLSAGIYLAAGSGAFDYVDLDGVHFIHHTARWNDIAIDGPRYHIENL